MVPSTRIERVTYPLGKGRSIQLSYEGRPLNPLGTGKPAKSVLDYREEGVLFNFCLAI